MNKSKLCEHQMLSPAMAKSVFSSWKDGSDCSFSQNE